jgi:hypothetical protein
MRCTDYLQVVEEACIEFDRCTTVRRYLASVHHHDTIPRKLARYCIWIRLALERAGHEVQEARAQRLPSQAEVPDAIERCW